MVFSNGPPEDFDSWEEAFYSGLDNIQSEARDLLEDRIANAPTIRARENAEAELDAYIDGLEEYDQWYILEQMQYYAETEDEWNRYREAYNSYVADKSQARLGATFGAEDEEWDFTDPEPYYDEEYESEFFGYEWEPTYEFDISWIFGDDSPFGDGF